MILFFLKNLWAKTKLYVFLAALGAVLTAFAWQSCASKRQHDADRRTIQELSQKLVSSEKTTEVLKDLYAKEAVKTNDLVALLEATSADSAASKEELGALRKQLKETGDQLAIADRLVIKWKHAYEGAVEASQHDVPGTDPDGTGPLPPVVRKQVDFSKDWGFIGVHGYTLTDPPEGYVVIEQLRPLKLTVAVARGNDRQWRAYVKSSEENVQVDIDLAGVDENVLLPRKSWRDRLWVDGSVGFLGKRNVGLVISYRFDRYSIGTGCAVGVGSYTCGLLLGFRPFK